MVKTYCPECDSLNVYRKKFPFYKAILVVLFVYIYLPLFNSKKHYCADCGYIWEQ